MKCAIIALSGAIVLSLPSAAQVTKALDAKYEQAKQRLQDTYVDELRKLRSDLNHAGNAEGVGAVEEKIKEILAPSFDSGLAGQSFFFKDTVTLDFAAGNSVNGEPYRITGPREIHFLIDKSDIKANFTQDWNTVTFATKNAVGADVTWISRKGDKAPGGIADSYWIKDDGTRFTSAIKITPAGHIEETWWENSDKKVTFWKLPYTKKGTDLEVVYEWGKTTFKFAKNTVARTDGFTWKKATEKEYLAFVAAHPPENTTGPEETRGSSSESKDSPFGRRDP